jgi:hypothetical protein
VPMKSYICTHGIIWGEISDSGTTTAYGHDALGSVTETFQGAGIENTYRYKPYGETLAKTGAAPDPLFTWNGGSGYRATSLESSNFYVVARHYSPGAWTTSDPIWPEEPAFAYANARPVLLVDRMGLQPPCSDSGVVGTTTGLSGGVCIGLCVTGPCPSQYNKCPLGLVKASLSDALAVTNCDESKYQVWTYSCDGCNCTEICTDCHENQHRSDIGPCCKQIGACIQKYGAANTVPCQTAYSQWLASVTGNPNLLECRGYAKDASCLRILYSNNNCSASSSGCCLRIVSQTQNYNKLLKSCPQDTTLPPCIKTLENGPPPPGLSQ